MASSPGNDGEGGKQPRQRRDVLALPDGAGPASKTGRWTRGTSAVKPLKRYSQLKPGGYGLGCGAYLPLITGGELLGRYYIAGLMTQHNPGYDRRQRAGTGLSRSVLRFDEDDIAPGAVVLADALVVPVACSVWTGPIRAAPRPFPAARYHSLIVDEGTLPPDLLITARAPGGIPMGLRQARHPAEGLQFHPESILTATGGTIIRRFIRAVRAARRTSPGLR